MIEKVVIGDCDVCGRKIAEYVDLKNTGWTNIYSYNELVIVGRDGRRSNWHFDKEPYKPNKVIVCNSCLDKIARYINLLKAENEVEK